MPVFASDTWRADQRGTEVTMAIFSDKQHGCQVNSLAVLVTIARCLAVTPPDNMSYQV